jgi:hypothetical protein
MWLKNHDVLAKELEYARNKPFRIGLASKSKIKDDAVFNAFSSKYPNRKIIIETFDVNSGVSKQPFDNDIYEGCFNRYMRMLELNEDNDILISIESGIIGGDEKEIGKQYEVTGIMYGGKYFETEKYKIDKDCLHVNDMTFGEYVKELYGYNAEDWYIEYGFPYSRVDTIKNKLMEII